jgi:hypothetical protein
MPIRQMLFFWQVNLTYKNVFAPLPTVHSYTQKGGCNIDILCITRIQAIKTNNQGSGT